VNLVKMLNQQSKAEPNHRHLKEQRKAMREKDD
jgi:hypothetical protein